MHDIYTVNGSVFNPAWHLLNMILKCIQSSLLNVFDSCQYPDNDKSDLDEMRLLSPDVNHQSKPRVSCWLNDIWFETKQKRHRHWWSVIIMTHLRGRGRHVEPRCHSKSVRSRGVTIHSAHDSIHITILGVQYKTYHDILNNIWNVTEIHLTDLFPKH